MEKYTIYSDGKSQCNENEYTIQSNLQHQCNSFQITSDILQKIRTKIVTVYVKTEKTLNSQSNLEKEKMELEESGSYTSNYTTKLQKSRQYDTSTKS